MFTSIRKYIRNAWKTNRVFFFFLIAGAVCSALIVVLSIYMPPKLISLFESGAQTKTFLYYIIGFVLGLSILKSIYDYLDTLSFFHVTDIRSQLMAECMEKSLKTSYANLMKPKFNGLLAKAMSLVSSDDEAAGTVWKTILEICSASLLLIILLLFVSRITWWVVLLTVCTALLSYWYSLRLQRWRALREHDVDDDFDAISYVRQVEQNREFALDLRCFPIRRWLFNIEDKSLENIEKFQKNQELRFFRGDVLDALLVLFRNGVVHAWLIWMIRKGQLTFSDFLLYTTAISTFSNQIFKVLQLIKQLSIEELALTSIYKFLEFEEPFLLEGANISSEEGFTLECRNVSYKYPESDRYILRHMQLVLKPGEKLAVVGLNGAGKTTLIKILAGFIEPTEGSVLLNGVDIRRYGRAQYYQLFTGVFQDSSILPLSIRSNVVQDGVADEQLIWQALETAELADKVRRLPKGIDTAIGKTIYRDGVEFSGGEMQRLQIARAMYRDAPILLLDEPTSALDPIVEREIYEKYNAITWQKSAIFVSHRLVSTKFSDRIILLADGRIIEEGNHETLMQAGGQYASLYDLQSKYYKRDE